MFNLVYASTATKQFSDSGLLDMLHQARDKNARLGITGLLLYKQGSFMQALEGEESTVRELYDTIRKDPRHHHVLTLMALPIPKHQFPNWSMGFRNLGDVGISSVPGYNPAPNFPAASDELSWQASVAMSLLATFAEEN